MFLLTVFEVIVGIFLFVTLHELGHVLMARLLGDHTANFIVLGRRKGEWVLATTFTRYAQIEDWGGVAVALAGPLWTRLLAEMLAVTLLAFDWGGVRPLVLTVFLMCRTDLWLYTIRNFITSQLLHQPQPGADVSDAVRGVSGLTGIRELVLFLPLLVLVSVDLWLGWPLIWRLLLNTP
ncbi:hypothetical protein [Deinococcus fonticola]|uniref:hypothetical protein n=1 Tax=Deinococcus fonticola TaxID=2528713 RepID=UPI001074D451|nr:hypothetical protein [Deinococcus fonticola]